MRWISTLAAASLLAAPLMAQAGDPTQAAAGTGKLPAGWSAKVDRGAPLTNVNFVTMGATGLHFTTGPALVVWKAADATTGAFHAVATFTQTKAPTHPEAYGMFIGGKNMDGAETSYMYFIIRGDGKYMVSKMNGTTPTRIVPWTDSDAVVKQDAAGKQTNKIEVTVGKDGKVSWMVNGKEVYAGTATPAELGGMVGLRVNHNLDVHVEGFGVHKQ